ncbi:MAG: hypothetical protein ABIZ49_12400 [Opitutaceae bacterium]
MLINPSVPYSTAESTLWSDVARLCRRICTLRERGQMEEAESLRVGPLAEMLAPYRIETKSDAETTRRLELIYAAEAERIANAAVLASLLAPLLNDHLQALVTALSHAAPVSSLASHPASVAPRAEKKSPPARRPAVGSIADFIDEMIAQERPPTRPGSAA